MIAGQKSTGHPVLVSSGDAFTTACDFRVLGQMELVWRRFYSNAIRDRQGPLGYGWTAPFFCQLRPEGEGHTFQDDEGGEVFFGVAEDTRSPVLAPGAFAELSRIPGRLIVTSWQWNASRIRRFVFDATASAASYPLIAIEDDEGRALDILRDLGGRMAAIRQRREDREVFLEYDGFDRIAAVWAARSTREPELLVRYQYDGSGRLAAATDAAGSTTGYEYNPDGRLAKEDSKDGAAYVFRYDARGRCVYTAAQDRYNEKTLRYHETLNWTEVVDSYGGKTCYQWLPSGQVVAEIAPGGAVKRTEYDDHGRITAVIDALNATTAYAYDDRGHRCSVTEPSGKTTQLQFNENHQPVAMCDSLGRAWQRQYDPEGRCTSFTDPLGRTWTYGYDAAGNLSVITDPVGSERRFTYDRGASLTVTDWAGNITAFAFDHMGRTIRRIDPLRHCTLFYWDALGRLTAIDHAGGAQTRCKYDAWGNMAAYRDPNGEITRFSYIAGARIAERVDPHGAVQRFDWGTEPRRLERVVNEKGETHRFVYDAAGRMIEEHPFDGRRLIYKYDPLGRCSQFTNGAGETLLYTHDAAGRMTSKVYPDGSVTQYTYDPDGCLLSAARDGSMVTIERDIVGRILRETQDHGAVLYDYDAIGNVERLQTSRGYDVRHEFDPRGYVTLLNASGVRMAFAHDETGNETGRVLPGGLRLEQKFDPAGQVIRQLLRRPGGGAHSILERSYEYDPAGNLLAQTDSAWGRTTYTYDPAGRILAMLTPDGAERFEYDPEGNITAIEGRFGDVRLSYLPGNRVATRGASTYKYDGNGRLVEKSEAQPGGPPRVWSYRWNPDDELVELTTPSGDTWRYQYDALGRRTAKHGPTASVYFLWEGTRLLEEFSSAGAESSWLFANQRLTPIAKLEGGQAYALLADHVGTPRELVDKTGRVVWDARFRAWGQVDRLAANEVDCPLRFPGQYFDAESGLHYSWFRYYDPEHGHFLSPDPIGLNGGINELLYAGDPVNWIDPWGLNACDDEEEEEPIEIVIDKKKYPEAAQHIEDNDPVTGRIDRAGAADRRAASMKDFPSVVGKDRDEVPPAILDTGGGSASVRPIDPSDNRGAGASMGNQMRGLPNGTLVRIVAR